MGIYKKLDIKISEDSARLSEKFYIYQNDRGIELQLKINLSRINFRTTKRLLYVDSGDIFVGATILKPNGVVIGREKVELVDDIIKFTIDEDLTDDIDEIGIYKVQFHLYDNQDNRITIPPVEFEVKELIGKVSDETVEPGVVGRSTVNHCVVASENDREIDIISNGRYIKTYWQNGDLITAKKLNNIENAIYMCDTRINSVMDDNDFINIEKVSYSNPSDTSISNVKDALDKLLYFDLAISLSSNIASTLEKGRVVDNVTFNWTYNKEVVTQKFNGVLLDNSVRSYNYTTPFNSNKTFTLNANDGNKDFSRNIGFSFLNGRYWGVSNASEYNSDFIKTLSKELSSSRNKTFTVNCGEGQHIFYCIPTSFGTPTFTVGGFSGGFSKVSTIQYSNIHGHVESYDIWKSTNSNLGNTTVVVS